MDTLSKEHLYNLSIVQPRCVGSSYRSPKSSQSSLMNPYHTSLLYPVPSAGKSGPTGSTGALHGLLGGSSLLPRMTAVAVNSDSVTTGEHSNTQSGDYLVRTGELIASPHSHYQVLELLGRGTFGQVLKCWKKDSNEVVAMKILKNLPSYSKQGQVEVDVLTTLSKVDAQQFNFVQAYESFTHLDHICIVFELLNVNLYDYLKQNHFQPLPLKHIRPIAQQVLMCLQKLKELGLVHADLKPENIMLVDPDRQPFRVKVIDFGSATVRATGVASTYLQSRYYRAPEVILGVAYDEAIDMWSLGCVLAELFLGWPLFPGATEYDQMLYMTQMLGLPPPSLTKNVSKTSRFFRRDSTGHWELKPQVLMKLENASSGKDMRKFIFTSVSGLAQVTSASSLSSSQQHSRSPYVSQAQTLDRLHFISLLETLLTFEPKVRGTPETCLQHSFVTMCHLSGLTEMVCVKEWIHCMQVCCQSRTTYSSPPIPQNVQLTSVPRLITPTTAPCNFMSNVQAPPPNQPHPSQAPPPHHPQYLHLPSHFTTQVRANNSSTHLLVATPTSSAVLVDTGYVSAESSPTLQTVWDLPKPGFPVHPGSSLLPGPGHQHYPSSLLLPVQTLATAPATLPVPVPPATLPVPPIPALYIAPSAAATYWLMLQQQQQQNTPYSSRL